MGVPNADAYILKSQGKYKCLERRASQQEDHFGSITDNP
jgi:glucose-6-phosphate 1-epimerase